MKDKALISGILILTIFITIMAFSASAMAVNIIIKAPSENVESQEYKQEFIFGFDQDLAMNNCSLIVDGEVKATRNTLITRESNKLTATLAGGSHEWQIICYDSANAMVQSQTQHFTIKVPDITKEGYETIYNNNGLRSYVITPYQGQAAIDLPAIKSGEDLRIKNTLTTYYIDVLKMGAASNSVFVEIRDRTSGKIYRLIKDENVSLDFNNDKISDISLLLKDVQRNVNAFFQVIPYPGSEPAPLKNDTNETKPIEKPLENPVPEEAQAEATTSTQEEPVEQNSDNEPSTTPIQPKNEGVKEANKNVSGTTLIIIGIIALIVIVGAIMLFSRKGKKTDTDKANKPQRKEGQQKLQSIEEKPKDDSKNDFDIIKSTGKKRR